MRRLRGFLVVTEARFNINISDFFADGGPHCVFIDVVKGVGDVRADDVSEFGQSGDHGVIGDIIFGDIFEVFGGEFAVEPGLNEDGVKIRDREFVVFHNLSSLRCHVTALYFIVATSMCSGHKRSDSDNAQEFNLFTKYKLLEKYFDAIASKKKAKKACEN